RRTLCSRTSRWSRGALLTASLSPRPKPLPDAVALHPPACGIAKPPLTSPMRLPCFRLAADDTGSVTAGERQLAGIGLSIVDQLLDRMDRQCWIDHQHQSETSHPGDRHKVLDRIVV